MTTTPYFFPFGQSVETLRQHDRDPKDVFVLGVYASAVHARWIGAHGETKVEALAVASEPYIFWRGKRRMKSSEGLKSPLRSGSWSLRRAI